MITSRLLKFGALLVVLSLVFVVGALAQTTWYVDVTNGDDTNSGSSATAAKRTISAVVNHVNFAHGDVVNVATGTYSVFEDATINVTKAVTFIGYIPVGSSFTTVVISGRNLKIDPANSGTVRMGLTGQPWLIGTATGSTTWDNWIEVTKGTWEISSNVTIANYTTITRVFGSLSGSAPTFQTNTSLYYDTPGVAGPMIAGNEVPASLGEGTIVSNRAQFETLIFPSTLPTLTIRGNGGYAIRVTGDGDVTFNNNVSIIRTNNIEHDGAGTLTFNGMVNFERLNAATGRIVNNAAGNIVFNGDVTFTFGGGTNNGNIIENSNAGSILFASSSTLHVAKSTATTTAGNVDNHEIATILFTGNGAGTIRLPRVTNASHLVVSTSVTRFVRLNILNQNTSTTGGVIEIGSTAGESELLGNVTLDPVASLATKARLNGNVTVRARQGGFGIVTVGLNAILATQTSNLTIIHLSGENPTHQIDGRITGSGTVRVQSSVSTSTGTITFATAGAGRLPNLEMGTNTTVVVALTGTDAITGGVTFATSGTGTLRFTGSPTVNGSVNISTGTLQVAHAQILTIVGNFTQSSGVFDGSSAANDAHTGSIYLRGNFSRTGGTYNPRSGTLRFAGSATQNFNAGANLELGSLEINTTNNAPVVFQASVIIRANGAFDINTGVAELGIYNVRLQTGASMTNASGYTATGGAIIFEGNGGGTLSGAGRFSNLDIRVGSGNAVTLGSDIELSGVLTLRSGTLDLSGFDLTLTDDYVRSTVRKNTVDTDGAEIDLNGGNFVVEAGTTYNVEFFGDEDASDTEVSASGWVPTQLYNLTIATGPGARTVTLPAVALTIEGSVVVNHGQALALNGQNLTAIGDVTHSIVGTMSGGNFIITGNNVNVTGDYTPVLNVVGANALPNVVVNPSSPSTATITFLRVRAMTAFTHSGGSTSLTMGGLTGETADILTNRTISGNFTMTAGTLTLGSWINVSAGNASHSGGVIALGANRLVFSSAGTFSLTNTGSYTATTGTVELRAGSVTGVPSPVGGTVPFYNLRVSTGTVTMTGHVEVSNAFTHASGTLALQTFNLTVSGNTITKLGAGVAPEITTTGGRVILTGSAVTFNIGGTATPAESYRIGNLELNSPGYVQLVAVTSTGGASATDRLLNIPGTFTMTQGELRLGVNDLQAVNITRIAGTVTGSAGFSQVDANVHGVNRGELVLNGGTLTPGTDFVIPNFRVAGNSATAGTNHFTVSNFFQFGDNSTTFTRGAGLGWIIIGEGATIIRHGTGTMSANPTFAGTHSVVFTADGTAYTTGRELAGGTLVDLVLNTRGTYSNLGGTPANVTFAQDRVVSVTNSLQLLSGQLNLATNTGTQVSLADGAWLVLTSDANIDHTGTVVDGIVEANARLVRAGSVKLEYTSYPGQAGATGPVLVRNRTWPATANVSELHLTLGDPENLVDFEFQLTGNRTVGALFVNTRTAGSRISIGDQGNALGIRTLTVTGNATITNGRISTRQSAAALGLGTLVLQGGVNISGGVIGATSAGAGGEVGLNVELGGTANQTVTLTGNQTINNLTINKSGTAPVPTVTLDGANLQVNGTLFFVNGIVKTDQSILILAGANQGFDRSGVTGTNVSHVWGAVRKAGTAGRHEYPVGTETLYRPVALTFITNTGANITVQHVNQRPTGIVGLPIANGVAPGVDIARYPSFYWNIYSNFSIGQAQFNLELTASGFTDFDDIANVRIIRRIGSADDVGNTWSLQGTNYDNFVAAGVPTVVNVNTTGGIRPEGAIFTYGLKSNLFVQNPIGNITLPDGQRVYRRKLSTPPLFGGNTGALSYAVSSSNTAVATAAITAGDSLTVRGIVAGTSTITVEATDAFDGSRITYSFTATVTGTTDAEPIPAIPTEFALEQNFPNPFNPSTTIRFALPKEAPVTLEVYNMLGMKIRTLVAGETMKAAFHQIVWDGRDDAGVTVPSGVYLYRIVAGTFQSAKRMTLVK